MSDTVNTFVSMSEQLLTKDEVCKHLSISMRSLDRMLIEKEIPHVKLGERLIRFSPAQLDGWLKDMAMKQIQQN